MLHKLLSLTRPFILLDTETTGTDHETDRIIEIGFQEWGPQGIHNEWRTLVNPGIPIPPESTAVHHITDEMVKDAPTFSQLCGLPAELSNCDFGGQNIRFDLRILFEEMVRAGFSWNYTDARIIDSYRLEAVAIPRGLENLHEKYTGMKHDGAHGALSDVRASATVIAHQLMAHQMLPRDLDALHAAQWPGYIDVDGKFRMIDGVPKVAFGKWKGKAMRSVPRDYWVWVSGPKTTFSNEVKLIAAAAMRGVFPLPETQLPLLPAPEPVATAKCDGNHAGENCGDKECWLQ